MSFLGSAFLIQCMSFLMDLCVVRLWPWAFTLEKVFTCRAAGTSWMACWCLCHWWTSWSPSHRRVETASWGCCGCFDCFALCDRSGKKMFVSSCFSPTALKHGRSCICLHVCACVHVVSVCSQNTSGAGG